MSVSFESVRFGAVEAPEEDVFEFPDGLVGLGGSCYALIDRNPGTGFLWLHAVGDPALALPVVKPSQFFSDFVLEVGDEDRQKMGIEDLSAASLYVTVRATPNPLDITANLKAPLVLHQGRGFQVINTVAGAPLQAPLFELASPAEAEHTRSADAA
jgi:flagellar assembly factor FliW